MPSLTHRFYGISAAFENVYTNKNNESNGFNSISIKKNHLNHSQLCPFHDSKFHFAQTI